jgi:hypothetical protein
VDTRYKAILMVTAFAADIITIVIGVPVLLSWLH